MSDIFEVIRDLENSLDGSIDPGRVEQLFQYCLAADATPPLEPDVVVVVGIVHDAAFYTYKIAESKAEIAAMLAQLPTEFRAKEQGGGGGWSFLNACQDRNGHQWTGLHWTMEMLIQLGIAAGFAGWQFPKEVWPALPGGMPYFQVTLPVG